MLLRCEDCDNLSVKGVQAPDLGIVVVLWLVEVIEGANSSDRVQDQGRVMAAYLLVGLEDVVTNVVIG